MVSGFIICGGLGVCTEILWMCVLYMSFGSKVERRTLGARLIRRVWREEGASCFVWI